MIATNHYLTGVAVAVALNNPVVALPAAFASHFVLDSLPHFGMEFSKNRGRILIITSILDALMFVGLAGFFAAKYPGWFMLSGIVAFSPDVAWIYRFIVKEKFGTLPPAPRGGFNAWHSDIQKLESPWGAIVDIGYLIAVIVILA